MKGTKRLEGNANSGARQGMYKMSLEHLIVTESKKGQKDREKEGEREVGREGWKKKEREGKETQTE